MAARLVDRHDSGRAQACPDVALNVLASLGSVDVGQADTNASDAMAETAEGEPQFLLDETPKLGGHLDSLCA